MEHGTAVEIHWVPSHMVVKENEKAEKTAKEAAEKPGTWRCPGRFTSLAQVSYTITERKWKGTNYWFKTKNDRCPPLQRARYDLALESQGTNTEAIKTVALVCRRYFQLKLGDAVIGTYLHRMDKTETDQCWECTLQARIDIHHVLLSCSA